MHYDQGPICPRVRNSLIIVPGVSKRSVSEIFLVNFEFVLEAGSLFDFRVTFLAVTVWGGQTRVYCVNEKGILARLSNVDQGTEWIASN